MPDKDEHMRAMVGDMVLTIATLKAEGDALKVENAALRQALAEAHKPLLVEPRTVGGFETDGPLPGKPGTRE
jgi:hypothetical protein